LPELEAVQDELHDQVAVVGIQIYGAAEKGAAVFQAQGIHYPSVVDPGLSRNFTFRTIPYSVLVRPDGRLGVAIDGAGDKNLFRQQALALLTQ
jgi:hypothetical protein